MASSVMLLYAYYTLAVTILLVDTYIYIYNQTKVLVAGS